MSTYPYLCCNFFFFLGFLNGTAACCGRGEYRENDCGVNKTGTAVFDLCSDPSQYVFFDGVHNTERTNHQLAALIWSGVPNVTGPYNVKQLFKLA
jgi:phospholipase/lecithinase/hemolysin